MSSVVAFSGPSGEALKNESVHSNHAAANDSTAEQASINSAAHDRTIVPDYVSSHSGLSLSFQGFLPVLPRKTIRRTINLVLKRVIDTVLASVLLLFLAPLLLLVALLIKSTSPGPVFFRQARKGLGGRKFSILKFRTMYTDRGDVAGVAQTVKGDTRITPLGNLLRRTNFDELPQLLNVVCGSMSLIGPRPHPIGMLAGGIPYEDLVAYYDFRYAVRPGISGWAQVNRLRGPTHDVNIARARIDHDVAYIQNFSIFLDSKIVVLTILREFLFGTGY